MTPALSTLRSNFLENYSTIKFHINYWQTLCIHDRCSDIGGCWNIRQTLSQTLLVNSCIYHKWVEAVGLGKAGGRTTAFDSDSTVTIFTSGESLPKSIKGRGRDVKNWLLGPWWHYLPVETSYKFCHGWRREPLGHHSVPWKAYRRQWQELALSGPALLTSSLWTWGFVVFLSRWTQYSFPVAFYLLRLPKLPQPPTPDPLSYSTLPSKALSYFEENILETLQYLDSVFTCVDTESNFFFFFFSTKGIICFVKSGGKGGKNTIRGSKPIGTVILWT